MATFSIDSESSPTCKDYLYKFHIQNHTSSRSLSYDFLPLLKGEFYRLMDGNIHGTVSPGSDAKVNFDIRRSGVFEKGDLTLITAGGHDVHFRFWSNSSSSEQYINLLPIGGFEVKRDTEKLNEIITNNLRITVDGGGKSNSTLNIYIQVYD
ncbi:hypothetical protein NIES22_63260 [Calothrix brevissima NIES-22]|nr:hypothetical protein NIES22_63260 [Calothrix brevissima NIES-22]